jgi:fluoroquinolone resistance protein
LGKADDKGKAKGLVCLVVIDCMDKNYIEDKNFTGVDFTVGHFEKADYENCRFTNCNFSTLDLSNISFAGCSLSGCNISLAKLTGTAFKGTEFNHCKMLGIHFEDCHELFFNVVFDSSQLNLSSFYKRKCRNTQFKNCSLHEVDFTEADCTNLVFYNCDLARAVFSNTNLEKADFRTSYNYSIDPELNRIRKAKFSSSGIFGLLDKYDIEID